MLTDSNRYKGNVMFISKENRIVNQFQISHKLLHRMPHKLDHPPHHA